MTTRSKNAKTTAPQIDAVRLVRLMPGDHDDLRPRSDVEDAQFTDLAAGVLDLSTSRFDASRIDGLAADELLLKATRFAEVILDRVDVPVVRAARTQWRDVRITGRLGSVEAYDVDWRSVHFVDCKINYLNLRGAQLLDVAFTNCQIGDLDLIGATARRVAFSGTAIGQLDVQQSKLSDVDLRGAELKTLVGIRDLGGATISSEQLTLLAPLFAQEFGLRVED